MSIRQFRHPRCARKHQRSETLLACMFPKLGHVWGDGRFVLLAYCDHLTARRYESSEDALAALVTMNDGACGSHCNGRHEVVELIDPAMALPWPT